MNNTCLLIALIVVIFIIMQNKGGLKGSLSVKSLSKQSKSVMNTNVPIICVGVLFLAYMFMNNGGIEGFSPDATNCGISTAGKNNIYAMLGTKQEKKMAKKMANMNQKIIKLTGSVMNEWDTDCTIQGVAGTPTEFACNRMTADGLVNNDCGYFYRNSGSTDLLMKDDLTDEVADKVADEVEDDPDNGPWKSGFQG